MNWIAKILPKFGNESFKFTSDDVGKIARGSLVAALGAGGAYALNSAGLLDWGPYTPLVVMLCAQAANALKVWVGDNSK